MSFKIVRNDITAMKTDAIVNTANSEVAVGSGCDIAIYKAAGYDRLLQYRKDNIGIVEEGEVFLTPGFELPAKYIIHAVSPKYRGGNDGEEEKLRSCYRLALATAVQNDIKSIAFPLISTGGFGYPKEEGIRIAADEINSFLQNNEMEVYLVVFDEKSTALGNRLCPDIDEYIDRNYVSEKTEAEYEFAEDYDGMQPEIECGSIDYMENRSRGFRRLLNKSKESASAEKAYSQKPSLKKDALLKINRQTDFFGKVAEMPIFESAACEETEDELDFEDVHGSRLDERMKHLTDTFSEYLLYLIEDKKMENADVYKRAIVDKKTFSKIKNNPDYHPQKITALCLCVGAKLNLDETKDLLARAGYALSPCDKTDIIFSYFIENEIYDMIELDIQLEEHDLPCIIA